VTREGLAAAAAPEDVAWALENQVERTWVKLRDHLAEADQLAKDYERLMDAGNWSAAREIALRLHREFDSTRNARRVKVPVVVATRPAGATLLRNGVPMERLVAGKSEVLKTPALVLCPFGEVVSMVATLDGFAPRSIATDGKKDAQIEVVLEVIADRRITFPTAAQTGVGIAEGWLAVGLRGGRLGLARTDGSSVRALELNGLRAVDSTPTVQNGRVFFTTNENSIECLPLDASAGAPWSIPVKNGFATELLVAEGRIAVVDRENVLHCWEQASGALAWSVSLDSAPSGPPTIDRRQVFIGTADGRVLRFDATDGRPGDVLRSDVPLATRVLADKGVLWFATSDGNVKAVNATEGRVLWTASLGRSVADGEMALSGQSVFAFHRDGSLVAIDRATGKITGRVPLQGAPQRGLRLQGQRLLLQLRRKKDKSVPAHDVLLAVHAEQLTLMWEFADQGYAPGQPGTDDFVVALPSVSGEVILFR